MIGGAILRLGFTINREAGLSLQEAFSIPLLATVMIVAIGIGSMLEYSQVKYSHIISLPVLATIPSILVTIVAIALFLKNRQKNK